MKVSPPSGTRDFLPGECKRRQRALATLRRVFELHGFEPIETPAFERIETLTGKYGEEGEKLIFKILRRGERGATGECDYALRYDLTVPLSRLYGQHRHKLADPFRRYHIGTVWRADRPGKGRFRELMQCDIDIVGSSSLMTEVEVLTALACAYDSLGLRVRFALNSRQVLFSMLSSYGVAEPLQTSALVALDKFDKIGADGVAGELAERGLDKSSTDAIHADLAATDASDRARARAGESDEGRAALASLDEITELLGPVVPDTVAVEFSPFLARGLDYYTGCIFEVFTADSALAVGAGGRYDNLLGMFAKDAELPAFGGSIGIDRVLMLLEEAEAQETEPRSQVVVGVWDEQSRADAVQVASRLRAAGLRAEVMLGGGNLSKQIKRASRLEVPCFVIRGPDERAEDRAMVKFLASGEQVSMTLAELAEGIATRVTQTAAQP